MENHEILNNIGIYEKKIRNAFSLSVEPKRFLISKKQPLSDQWATAKHALYIIREIYNMIDKNEKEQRIHRHYGFLQAVILLLIPNYSIEQLMEDNKFGAH